MIVFTQTDFPEPVAPAMSKCGIFARSAITARPSRSLPSAIGSAARICRNSADSSTSRSTTISGVGLGTSTPTAPRPGIGATMRILGARMANARSSASAAICRTFTPGAGSISNCVTVGPVVRPTSSPSTLNVRSVVINFSPARSSSRLPASAFRAGAAVSKSVGGKSSLNGDGSDAASSAPSTAAAVGRAASLTFFFVFAPSRPVSGGANRASGLPSPSTSRANTGSMPGNSSGSGSSCWASVGRLRLPTTARSPLWPLAALSASGVRARGPSNTRIGFHRNVATVSALEASRKKTQAPAEPSPLRR